MPYSSNADLPESVRSKYSEKCQRAFRHAFNSTYEDTHDDGRSMASGHAAAQRCEEANKSMNSEFKVFTGLLKTSRSSDGKMRLHGVASSTTKDLHGDVMTQSAIDDMEKAANNNLTIFLNHQYNVPEDVAGSVERAKSRIRDVDHEGNPNVDLDLDIVINDENPRAVQAFNAIEKGTKLGLSIGAMIPEGGAKRTKGGTYVIEHVDLLETSLVSIPANPRSWVEYAAKSLRSKGELFDESVVEVLEDGSLVEHTKTGVDFTIDLEDAATCPSCGGSKGAPREGCTNDFHAKDIEPDVQDATVTVETPFANITVDTSDGDAAREEPASQEATDSAPENEDGVLDETADGDDAKLGDTTTRSESEALTTFSEAISLLRQTTRDLVETRRALADAQVAKAAAERERDALKAERDTVLTQTQQILDRVANSPLVRRAVVMDAKRDFRARFEGIYSEDFLKMLQRNDNE